MNSDSVKLKEISEHLGKTITENPYAVGTLILLETGVIIVLFSAYNSLTNPSDFLKLFSDVGKAMIVSAFAGYIFNSVINERSTTDIKIINDNFEKASDKITENFTKTSDIKEASIKQCIEDGKKATFSDSFINCFLDSDLVTKYGLVKVHASRKSAINSLDAKIKQVNDQNVVNVYLCGITLRDFFRKDGIFYQTFQRWLRSTVNLKAHVIILDKKSKAAEERAIREDPKKYAPDDNGLSRELDDTEASIKTFLEDYPKKINVKKSTISPLCFLVVVNDTMIMEPYNYATSGGNVPVFEIKRSNNDDLFNIYMKHFVSLWIKPCKGREDKKIEELVEYIQDTKSTSKSYADLPWNECGQIEFCKEAQNVK
ncbi:MAG: hypothetical protein AB9861_03675 [Methanosarcina sp.]